MTTTNARSRKVPIRISSNHGVPSQPCIYGSSAESVQDVRLANSYLVSISKVKQESYQVAISHTSKIYKETYSSCIALCLIGNRSLPVYKHQIIASNINIVSHTVGKYFSEFVEISGPARQRVPLVGVFYCARLLATMKHSTVYSMTYPDYQRYSLLFCFFRRP